VAVGKARVAIVIPESDRMRKFFLLALFIICGIAGETAASQLVAQKEKPSAAAESGANTPNEAFSKFRDAVVADNWQVALKVLTPESRELITSSILAQLSMGMFGDQGKKLANEAANRDETQKIIDAVNHAKPEDQEKIGRKLAALVKDQPVFIAKALKLFPKDKPADNWLIGLKETKLQDLKIDGDTAKGSMRWSQPVLKKSGDEPIGFQRTDGKWYIQFMH
jgi:hypothetical protein